MATVWRARAPVRFCDLGGWTDTRICRQGSVLNLAASLFSTVTLTSARASRPTAEFHGLDTDDHVRLGVDEIRKGEYRGTLDLFHAALRRSGLELSLPAGMYGSTHRHIHLTGWSDAPPGSGLGTSAAMGVAAVAVLDRALGRSRHLAEIAREAQELETQELQLECGVQDQIAAVYGGISYMEVTYPQAIVQPVRVSDAVRRELDECLLLVYTGKSHFSSAIHRKVIAEYEAGRNCTFFEQLAQCAPAGRDALIAGDLRQFADIMNANWAAQMALHPDITTPDIEKLAEAVMDKGAIGFKANGAGGGGTVTLLIDPAARKKIKEAVRELGQEVLPARISDEGVASWERET